MSTTTTTTTTAAATTTAVQPQTTREVTEQRKTLQSGKTPVSAAGKVESKELDWPFGGGGVMWVEGYGEEKHIKGSAVVEVEEGAVPRTIFEEVFGLDK